MEIRCDELETIYETTRHDLDVTREALARYHESQQESTRTGKTYLFSCRFAHIFKPELPALGLLYPPLFVRPSVRPHPSRPKSQF